MAEDAAADSPKRKRGRPSKPEGEKVAAKKAKTEGGTGKRGRPKGSKNKAAAKKPKEILDGRPLNVLGKGVRHVKSCGLNWLRPSPERSPGPREAQSDGESGPEPKGVPDLQSGSESGEEEENVGTGKRGRPAKNAAPKEESPAEESAEGEDAE